MVSLFVAWNIGGQKCDEFCDVRVGMNLRNEDYADRRIKQEEDSLCGSASHRQISVVSPELYLAEPRILLLVAAQGCSAESAIDLDCKSAILVDGAKIGVEAHVVFERVSLR